MSAIILDCIQGSAEWHAARLGVVTASEVGRIITPAQRKLASGRYGYMNELLAEWVLGYSENEFAGSYWTERGIEFEAEALAAIAFITDAAPRAVGLVYRDESRTVACSPDALLGETGGAEIKCPKASTHIGYMQLDAMPGEYVPQVQMSLWVTGREFWIFESYHPALPPVIHEIAPASEWQDALSEYVPAFVAEMEQRRAELISAGVKAQRIAA